MIITQESLLLKNYLAGFQKSRLSFSFRRVLPPAITQLFTGIQRAVRILPPRVSRRWDYTVFYRTVCRLSRLLPGSASLQLLSHVPEDPDISVPVHPCQHTALISGTRFADISPPDLLFLARLAEETAGRPAGDLRVEQAGCRRQIINHGSSQSPAQEVH